MLNVTSRSRAPKTAIAVVAATLWANSLAAQDWVSITLTSNGTVVEGELVEFSNDRYVVRTPLGDLHISAQESTCDGSACPQAAASPTTAIPGLTELQSSDLVDGAPAIRISGSAALSQSILPSLLERYAAATGDAIGVYGWPDTNSESYQLTSNGAPVRIDVAPQTVALSFRAMAAGDQDIIMAYRPIADREITRLARRGLPEIRTSDQQVVLGVMPFVLVVDPALNVTSLTMQQIRDIYVGRYTNWSELGGAAVPIMVISRESGVEARQVSDQKLRGDTANLQGIQTIFAVSSNEALDLFEDHPGAVGFVSNTTMNGLTEVEIIDDCGDPLTHDQFSIASEDYPLAGRVYLYMRQDTAAPETLQFWDFVTDSDTASLTSLEQQGFTSNMVVARAHSADIARNAGLQNQMESGNFEQAGRLLTDLTTTTHRLSSTFRFQLESGAPDERTDQTMQHLAQFLQENPNTSQVIFAGFSHADEIAEDGLAQSAENAQRLQDMFNAQFGTAFANMDVSAAGYGELAPITCNDVEIGRQTNERVEVWIR